MVITTSQDDELCGISRTGGLPVIFKVIIRGNRTRRHSPQYLPVPIAKRTDIKRAQESLQSNSDLSGD